MNKRKYPPPYVNITIIRSKTRILVGSNSIKYSDKDEYADPDLEVL
jgi:hypothetical protein